MTDLQKAGIWKRIGAWAMDLILLSILATGAAFLASWITDYDGYNQKLNGYYDLYAQKYGLKLDITWEEYNALTQTQKDAYQQAVEALNQDQEATRIYGYIISLTLSILSTSILVGYTLLEFVVPMLLGNGQTLGKRVFSLAVTGKDGVKISNIQLFIRTFLGKFALETMIPALILLMVYFGMQTVGALLILVVALAVQVLLMANTRNRSAIHDLLSKTAVVDKTSQVIFESRQELQEYLHEKRKEKD